MPKKVTTSRASEEAPKRNGWGAVARRQAENEAKAAELDNAVREFWLKDGESATIQFLEGEPYCYDAHNVKDRKGNWTVVPCQLNNSRHCALCADGIKQTWRAAFVILDYRGSWDKDKKKFRNDEPVVKIWRMGTTIAQQIKQMMDKKGRDLTDMVLEVTRSGSGKDSSYNFEQAFDDDDRRLKPIKWDKEFPSSESLCQPPTEDEIDARGYTAED